MTGKPGLTADCRVNHRMNCRSGCWLQPALVARAGRSGTRMDRPSFVYTLANAPVFWLAWPGDLEINERFMINSFSSFLVNSITVLVYAIDLAARIHNCLRRMVGPETESQLRNRQRLLAG